MEKNKIEMRKNNTELMRNKRELKRNHKVKLVETENYINLIKYDTDNVFNIPKDTLGDTMLFKGVVCSKWITHLYRMMWCSVTSLYQLAVVIERDYPNEDINWIMQFYDMELVDFKYNKYGKVVYSKNMYPNLACFVNSPYSLIPKTKREDVDEIIDIVSLKFEIYGMNAKILSK